MAPGKLCNRLWHNLLWPCFGKRTHVKQTAPTHPGGSRESIAQVIRESIHHGPAPPVFFLAGEDDPSEKPRPIHYHYGTKLDCLGNLVALECGRG